jgi:hypothetical protein
MAFQVFENQGKIQFSIDHQTFTIEIPDSTDDELVSVTRQEYRKWWIKQLTTAMQRLESGQPVKDAEYDRLLLIEKLVKEAVTQRCDHICWRDLYTNLAKLVGVEFVPDLIDDPAKMKANCDVFIDSLYNGPYKPIYHEVQELTWQDLQYLEACLDTRGFNEEQRNRLEAVMVKIRPLVRKTP